MSYINQCAIRELVKQYESLRDDSIFYEVYGPQQSTKSSPNESDHIICNVDQFNRKVPNKRKTISKQPNDQITFSFRELKIFKWVLALYCAVNRLSLKSLTKQDYQTLLTVFPYKTLLCIQYSVLELTHAQGKVRQTKEWSSEEVFLFRSLINEKQNIGKWKLISYEFFLASQGKYFRAFQECREKWNNHLDPHVKKAKWEYEEDIELLKEAQNTDCNWTRMCEQMGGVRTQHQIRNRYNSIINKYRKGTSERSSKKIRTKALRQIKLLLKKQKQQKEEQIYQQSEQKKIADDFVETKQGQRISLIEANEEIEAEYKAEDSAFVLGNTRNFTYEWPLFEEKHQTVNQDRFQTHMFEREDDFDKIKGEDERSTAEKEEEEEMLEIEPFKIPRSLYGYPVSNLDFQNDDLIQVQSNEEQPQWLSYFDERSMNSIRRADSFQM